MENHANPEMIRRDMEQTRTALSEKLEALESQVFGTVQSATCAVQETVTTVKSAVAETVTSVKDAVQGTVSTFKTSVDETVGTVKSSLGGTVGTVKETLDLELQVHRHPWAMVGGAVAAGYLGGIALNRLNHPPAHYLPSPATPAHLTGEGWAAPRATSPLPESAPAATPAGAAEESWAGALLNSFEPEVDKLKGIAIGALFNVVKGMARQYVPRNLEPQFTELVDSVTRKMGGKPLQGSIMDEYQHAFR